MYALLGREMESEGKRRENESYTENDKVDDYGSDCRDHA